MTDFHSELAQLLFPHVSQDAGRLLPPVSAARSASRRARDALRAQPDRIRPHRQPDDGAGGQPRRARRAAASISCASRTPTRSASRIAASSRSSQTLNNFDLTPDEGVVGIDPLVEVGAYAPYTQSERVEIYETFAKDHDRARHTPTPASAPRKNWIDCAKQQEAQHVKPGYYGRWAKWRDATLEQVQGAARHGQAPGDPHSRALPDRGARPLSRPDQGRARYARQRSGYGAAQVEQPADLSFRARRRRHADARQHDHSRRGMAAVRAAAHPDLRVSGPAAAGFRARRADCQNGGHFPAQIEQAQRPRSQHDLLLRDGLSGAGGDRISAQPRQFGLLRLAQGEPGRAEHANSRSSWKRWAWRCRCSIWSS